LAHILTEVPDFSLKECQICILDESDRLMEMGFAVQLRQISKSLPNDRCQKVLLSATMPKSLVEFAKSGFANDPQVVRLDAEATVSDELRISFITCRSLEKDATLLNILSTIKDDTEANESTRTGLTLVFCATRHHVEFVTTLLRSSGLQATMIYGTLDIDARNSNLAAFRNGRQPILVVTDVAARGVDIPMCDHVIHYHFPPTPKLFVHRSGRVARAGRIGFCWGLVEPDELPYMVDLHLFLGRKLTTANGVTRTSGSIADIAREEEEENNHDRQKVVSYTLNEMTAEMVHYGCIPESTLNLEVENVRRIMDAELAGSEHAEIMRALTKVCQNGMKQYRKTRPEASREGVRRAKAILEGLKTETGQRIGGSATPPHPLLHGLEMAKYDEQKAEGKIGSLNDLENVRKRQEFLQAMSNFRPKETVFEAFATGGGKETGVLSQVDKGRTVASSKKNDSSYALSAMKHMRRQMKMARDKGSTLVVAGSLLSEEMANTVDNIDPTSRIPHDDNDANESGVNSGIRSPSFLAFENPSLSSSKPRISKAARRRMKKDPDTAATIAVEPPAEKRKKNMRGTDFRDNSFFIDNEVAANPEEANRLRQVEAAMQPSAANAMNGIQGNAMRLEEAIMDVVGDESDQLIQKQRLMRWDKSKRKYIQTTVGSELSGESWSKRIKLESGQIVKSDKLKLGEVYEKWQKKTNRSVGRDGVFDSNGGQDGEDGLAKQDRRGGKKSKKGGGFDKPKSAQAIKMGRERQQDLKLKNMKKGDRKRLERGSKKEQDGKPKPPAKKGSQGKRGMSGRWKK
jgi:ATP-dependent RNA helicase DDX54/DBP10